MYRAMIGFFPREFQRAYSDEMIATFRDGLRDATAEGRLPMFWLESAMDVISSLQREHRRAQKEKPMPSTPVNYRYTDDARLLFHYARLEQFNLKHSASIDAEHLLLAIVLQDGVLSQTLQVLGCTAQTLRERIKRVRHADAIAYEDNLNEAPMISVEIENTMTIAAKLARTRGDGVIEPHYILLAILEQPSSLACKLLTDFASPDDIRARI
jgi:Clp amino terminal domain, pathogenicity island component